MNNKTSEHPVEPETRLALADQISVQGLGNEEGGVLLKMDSGEMYTVNETTMAFIQGVDGNRSISDIAEQMVTVFDVEPDVLKADLVEVANELLSESLLVVRS